MTLLQSVPKPERNTTDYKAKSIEVASKIVCLVGRCAMCGTPGEYGKSLAGHHIIHRRHGNTTALLINLLPVCPICHDAIHHDEDKFKAWLEYHFPGLYGQLWRIAQPVCRLDFFEVYSGLLELYYGHLTKMKK